MKSCLQSFMSCKKMKQEWNEHLLTLQALRFVEMFAWSSLQRRHLPGGPEAIAQRQAEVQQMMHKTTAAMPPGNVTMSRF